MHLKPTMMKKAALFLLVFLAFGFAAKAQEKPRSGNRPVTQKPQNRTEVKKAEPTAEGQRSQQKAEDEIRRSRAEKRAKMEQAKKDMRDRIASDTLPKR